MIDTQSYAGAWATALKHSPALVAVEHDAPVYIGGSSLGPMPECTAANGGPACCMFAEVLPEGFGGISVDHGESS